MPTFDPLRFPWPTPWRPLTDDAEALAFGRFINPAVAPTVLGELRREICDRHPLAGVPCRPVAYDAGGKKDFLFLTPRPARPVVLVHFTWGPECDPRWPFVLVYRSLEHFARRERRWLVEARVRARRWRDVVLRRW